MAAFTEFVDLAAARLGGVALLANDEFFAEKENLLKPEKPIWIADKYTDRGKWMDGWESRRRRTPGHDWCVIRLGIPGVIRGVVVDTSFFTGNFPSHCSLDACAAPADTSGQDLASERAAWVEVLSTTELLGDSENLFELADPRRFTHVRLNIFPDGGVARLRVHGERVPDWTAILASASEVNVVAVEHGGRVIDCSDKFCSHPQNSRRITGEHGDVGKPGGAAILDMIGPSFGSASKRSSDASKSTRRISKATIRIVVRSMRLSWLATRTPPVTGNNCCSRRSSGRTRRTSSRSVSRHRPRTCG
jgi:hypothetical protein